jgi:hypothetical protein
MLGNMSHDELDFSKLLDHLHQHHVEFIVCGGLAVSLNGFVRTTDDVDILISAQAQNVEKLAAALKVVGEGYGGNLTPNDLPLEAGAVRIIEEDFILDVFTLMGGQTYEQLRHECPETQLPRSTARIPYLSRRRLWELKKDSPREKDQIDAAALKRLEEGKPLE